MMLTNVIIDVWKKDEVFFPDSFASYDVCVLRGWEPYIALTPREFVRVYKPAGVEYDMTDFAPSK